MASTITIKPYDPDRAKLRRGFLEGAIMPNGEFVSGGKSFWISDGAEDGSHVSPCHVFEIDERR